MKKDTRELVNQMISSNDIFEFTHNNEPEFVKYTLNGYLKKLLQNHNKRKMDVIKDSGLDITYAYQIFDGRRKKPDREKLLQLALGFPLTLFETNCLLRIGGVNELYVRTKRDAILMYCLHQGCNLQECNIYLYNMDEVTVPKEE